MDYKKNFQELEKGLLKLIEENKKVPIVVEGDKDVFSLRKLGIAGEIITINSGFYPRFTKRPTDKGKTL